jgi:hypothetical protein
MDAVVEGARGIIGPDAIGAPRPARAAQGRSNPEESIPRWPLVCAIRLSCRRETRPGVLLDRHPILFYLYCSVQLGRWSLQWAISRLLPKGDRTFVKEVMAIERAAVFMELLKLAGPTRRRWKEQDRKKRRNQKIMP